MQHNFNKHINKNFPFLKKAKVLVAISGGIDSVVLTYLLHQLKIDINLAHCNFNLRGVESDRDENFVRDLANQLKIDAFITHFNTKEYAQKYKLSIQEAARNLRYHWFDELLEKHGLDYVLTAHNLNDNLETFLINLTRGTGLQGLTGIPIINNKTLRPLLEFSREQIENFAKANTISWREDLSNADTKYTRNKIRHKVIPVLQELNPSLLDSFKNTITHLNDSEEIINETVEKFKQNIISTEPESATRNLVKVNIEKIQNLKNPNAYLYEIFKNYGFTEFNDILNLLTAQSGKQVFSKTHRLIKDRDYLLLTLREENIEKREERRELRIEENDDEFKINNLKFKIKTTLNLTPKFRDKTPNLIQFDKDLLKFPLKVRKWQKGDYFYPIGMTGKKKLSKFFKDEKYSLLEKENIWLLLSDNQIVWIIGKRQDNRFKMTKSTKQILEILL